MIPEINKSHKKYKYFKIIVQRNLEYLLSIFYSKIPNDKNQVKKAVKHGIIETRKHTYLKQ